MFPEFVKQIADDQTSMYDPGHRADQDAQCNRWIPDAWQKSEHDRRTKDRLLESVFSTALVVYILEHRPDDARKEKHQRRWPEYELR